MGMAICFKCGSAKSGALVPCQNCKVAPKTNSEYAISLALSDHLSTKDQLAQYSHELRNAQKLSAPREALVQALDALKDPQLLAMLRAQAAAENTPPPSGPLATPAHLQAPATLRATPSTSIAVSGTNVFTQGGILREAIGIETLGSLGSSFTAILPKGSKLPCVASKTFSTGEDGQDQITLHPCSGDTSLSKIIQSFGKFQISGIAQMPKGKPSILVEFKGELGGITLKVTDNLANSTLTIKNISSLPKPVPRTQLNTQLRATAVSLQSKPAPRFAATALNKSPFAVLGVTTRDDRRRIVEVAEEKSLELDHGVCQKAGSDLTKPRARLGAEIAWLPGVAPRKASQLADGLLQNPMAVREESGLPTLAHLNLMASAFETMNGDHDSDDMAKFIQEVAHRAEELSPEDVLRDINEDRAVSGFPEVKIEQVEEELSERKRYYRNAIKEALDRLPSAKLVQVMTETVDGVTSGGEDHAPGLIDDLVDSYEVETHSPLQSGAEKIHELIQSAKDAAPSGEVAVKPYVDKIETATRSWDRIAQPIQLSAKARGTEHDLSSNLGWAIRGLALDLFNKHDILSQTQRLTALLRELFSEIPEILERVQQDADALDNIASDRNKIAEKFKDFSLTGNSFSWKNRAYDVNTINHIGFYRAVTTHKTNFIETGKTEKAILTLTLSDGQTINISIDEQGIFWRGNYAQKIRTLADFYGYLMHVTFDRRLKFYEDQIERNGYWLYDECYFYPNKKVVFRGRDFDVGTDSFLRSYGNIELRKKDYGLLDKLKREVSLTKTPQFNTLTDTDVIFHMLEKHMGLRWSK